jgi:uncharacterized protein (TIGR03437 family)
MHHRTQWVVLLASLSALGLAQAPAARERTSQLDWRRIGNTTLELGLASPAGGPVDRVWYSDDGSTLYVRIPQGRIFETTDFEQWKPSSLLTAPPEAPARPTQTLPENLAKSRTVFGRPSRLYAAGRNAFRSDDGGVNWTNLTQYQNRSIIGEGLLDLAVSPHDPDDVVAVGTRGVWRSVDGGSSWTGLNQTLPNLPVRRFVRSADTGTIRIAIDESGTEAEWKGGEKAGWRLASGSVTASEALRRGAMSTQLSAQITVIGGQADVQYAGSVDGRIWASADRGRTWQPFKFSEEGGVAAIVADAKEPNFAVALLTGKKTQVARTTNGGRFWDLVTDNLPNVPATGIAADRASGAIYVATASGVFMSLGGSAGATWNLLRPGNALDVMLDPDGNQLFVAFQGTGVYASLAPHRLRDPRVVSSGDLATRAAAPGSLLTVIGAKVQSARTGEIAAPVLAASDTQSQIQIPFEAAGESLSLALDSSAGRFTMGLPLQETSPAIFVDPDGSPLIVNAETGLMLDGAMPARRNARLQIFATGLGRVRPEWPTGMAAPLQDAPAVVAPVSVFIDNEPVQVTRAVLAPGYIGFYLVEVQLPDVLNSGTADLHIETEGHQSNHVRIYLEP